LTPAEASLAAPACFGHLHAGGELLSDAGGQLVRCLGRDGGLACDEERDGEQAGRCDPYESWFHQGSIH
jgi:hypothetical protein